MRPIPKKMKEEMAADPFWSKCVLWTNGTCEGRVEWHHVFIYAGRQINEKWAIMPACQHHHNLVKKNRRVSMLFECASLNRATEEDLAKYPKYSWSARKKFLNRNAYPIK